MADDSQFVDGAARLSRRIATITSRLALPILTVQIGDLLVRRTLERFDREVDPDGKPWKDLENSTLERKKRAGKGGQKKLVRDKSLRNAIQRIRGGEGSFGVNTGAGVRIGIDSNAVDAEGEPISVYARIQNRERRFLGVGRLDVKSVDSFLRRQGDDAIEG